MLSERPMTIGLTMPAKHIPLDLAANQSIGAFMKSQPA